MTNKRTAAGGIRPGTARKLYGPALTAAQVAQQVPGQTEFEMRGLTSTGGESPTVG